MRLKGPLEINVFKQQEQEAGKPQGVLQGSGQREVAAERGLDED